MVKTTNKKVRKIVSEFLENLKQRQISVSKIILFGSYATNRQRKDSDMDLAVISPYFENTDFFDRLVILGRARIGVKEPLEILGYTPREYTTCEKGTFLEEIKHTGKVVYSNSK